MILLGLESYALPIAMVFLCLLLGVLVIAVPRPRKKYLTATERREKSMKKVKRKRPAVNQQAR